MQTMQGLETTPLIQRSSTTANSRHTRWLTRPVILLLLMKLMGGAFQYQLMAFDIDNYTPDLNNTDRCLPVPYKPRSNLAAMILVAAGTFLLPTLGGLISDKYFGCVKVLTSGCIIQFWLATVHTLFIQLSILCHHHFWFLLLAGGLTLALGLVDPLLMYALMQNVNSQHCRRFLVFAYFVVAAGSECLGNLPTVLRYLLRNVADPEGFQFLGIIFAATLVVCTFLVTSDDRACEKLRNENFEFPRLFRLRRFYIIVAGFIPFQTVIVLCRNVFYWKEITYYTKDEDAFVSYIVPMAGFLFATIGFSLIGAVATAMGRFPQTLTIGLRIRLGMALMLTCKIVLFAISFAHTGMSELGQSNPTAVRLIYFAAAFIDGFANALTDAGMYELVACIAERCASAMYMGIFYTTWGLGLMLTGMIVALLKQIPSEGEEMLPKPDVQPQFFIRYITVIVLLVLCYAYFIKVAWPLAEPLIDDTLRMEEEAEVPQD